MELKQSGLGIASFILSILCGLLIFVMFIIAGVMEASSPGGIDERSAGAVVLGLIEAAKARGAAILGIFDDEATRGRVCDRLVDVTGFTPKAAA